jgi:hypothetical protein
MAIELTDAGRLHLAVSLGTATRGAALTRILALRAAPGWIAGPTTGVREWRFEGVVEHDGKVYLIGPHVPGVSLHEVLAMPARQALPFIARLVSALLQLSETGAGWFPLQSDSVIFTDEQTILFLPPSVDRELRDLLPFESHRETFECLNHPDLKGAPCAAFSVAAGLFRIITGRFPFWGSDAGDLHEEVRSLEIQPPASLVPGLEQEGPRGLADARSRPSFERGGAAERPRHRGSPAGFRGERFSPKEVLAEELESGCHRGHGGHPPRCPGGHRAEERPCPPRHARVPAAQGRGGLLHQHEHTGSYDHAGLCRGPGGLGRNQ